MKIIKKILIGAVILLLFVFIIGACSGGNDTAEQSAEPESTSVEQPDDTSNAFTLNTPEDVDAAYDEKIKAIYDKEKIQDLGAQNFENLKEYANHAKEVSVVSTDPAETINKMVALDDLQHNTSVDVLNEAVEYLTAEYKNNALESNAAVDLYIARYCDKYLTAKNDTKTEGFIYDVFQVCRNYVNIAAGKDDGTLEHSNTENIYQIEKYLNKK